MRFISGSVIALLTSCSLLSAQDSTKQSSGSPEFLPGVLNQLEYFRQSRSRGQAHRSFLSFAVAVYLITRAQRLALSGGTEATSNSDWDSYLVSEPGNNRVLMLDGCDNSVVETFNGPSDINFGSSLAVADLDDNGYEDVLVGARGGRGAGSIAVFRRGPGVIGGTIPQATSGSTWATHILVADLDGDGSKEIIVSDRFHDGLAGTSTGWVGIYDAITLQMEVEMEGPTDLGIMGAAMTIANWPGRSNPVLLVSESGYDNGKGRICVLDGALNIIDEILGTVTDGRLGSGFLGQDPDGNIVIGSPFASLTATRSYEGNITIFNPSTDSFEMSHDGANPGEELGR
ncbi:MAG: FG-GAP repeat domain-containing protein, partial [Planctomycetota bacterium]